MNCNPLTVDPQRVYYEELSCFRETVRDTPCRPKHLFSQQGYPLVLTGLELPRYDEGSILPGCYRGFPNLSGDNPRLSVLVTCRFTPRPVSFRLEDGISEALVSRGDDESDPSRLQLEVYGSSSAGISCWGG